MATSGTTVHGRQGARSQSQVNERLASSLRDQVVCGMAGKQSQLKSHQKFLVPDKAFAKKRTKDVKQGNQESCAQSGGLSRQNTSIHFMNPCPEEWPQ